MNLRSAIRGTKILIALVLAGYGLVVLGYASDQNSTGLIRLGYVGLCAAAVGAGWAALLDKPRVATAALALSLLLVPALFLAGVACCL